MRDRFAEPHPSEQPTHPSLADAPSEESDPP
jgi:hypothetical protein